MRNTWKRALFWTTFFAVWFDTSRTWTDLLGHFALGHYGPSEVMNLLVICFVTLHALSGGGDHG